MSPESGPRHSYVTSTVVNQTVEKTASPTPNVDSQEEEIIIQILCRMKDKDLQKDLWTKHEEHEDLAKVLATIRASEAAGDSQAASGSESGSAALKK